MQIEHKKNTDYYLAFPMVDDATPSSFRSGETVTDTAYSKDGAAAWTTLNIVDTATEISTTGVYEIDLSPTEMNHDQIMIKFTAANSADTAFLIDTRTKITSDLNDLTATDILSDGTALTTSAGTLTNVTNVATVSTGAITAGSFATGAIDNTAFNVTETLTANPAAGGISAASFAAGAINAAAIANGAIDAQTFAAGAIDNAAFNVTETLTANPAAGGISAASFATDAIDAAALATDAVNEIRDAIMPVTNTTLENIMFLFVAASDHVTPVTNATGTAVTRSLDGAAFTSGTGTLAEVANGIYQYDASPADMNAGVVTFRFTATGGTPGAPDDAFVTVVTNIGT